MATTSVLETLDKIAKEYLDSADRNMVAINLDQAVEDLSRADAAVYIMARAPDSDMGFDHTPRDVREASQICFRDRDSTFASLGWENGVVTTAHAEYAKFYESRGYVNTGLLWDHWAIKNYIQLVEHAKSGNYSAASAIEECVSGDITFGKGFYNGWKYLVHGSLPKKSGPFEIPKLVSREALKTILDYAKIKEAQNIWGNLSLTQKLRKTISERVSYPFQR